MRYKRVLLVFPDYKGGHFGALRPPAGLGYLAEALEAANIEYDVCDMAVGYSLKYLAQKITALNPDLVAISLMSFMYNRSYEIIRHVKKVKPSLHIIAGGPHVSTLENSVLEDCHEIDYGIVMEGEKALVELCKGKELSEIKGLIFRINVTIITNERRPFEEDLDNLPFPRYKKFPLNRYVTGEIGIVSSRGCPYNCIYCPVNAAIGRRWRKRSAQSIIEEIMYWYNRGYRQFSMLDDNFTLNQKRVFELCEQIKNSNFRNVEFNCNNGVRADNVSYDVLKKMREAGFEYIAFGVESGNNEVLKTLGKGESLEVIENAIKDALSLGYKVTLFFLVGSPGETVEKVGDSVRLALKYPVFDARFYNLVPFPQSRLYNWVKENDYFLVNSENYLNNCSQWDNEPVFETPEMDAAERAVMLRYVKSVRKKIRCNSMKTTLKAKLGPLATPIAKFYVTDGFQNILMKNRFLRKNLKSLFQKAAKA